MFVEEEFDDHREPRSTEAHAQGQRNRVPHGRSTPSFTPTHTLHFHRPGEEGFCSVAGAGDDTEALLDARTVSGDSWVSDQCRCLRCECLRVLQKLDGLQRKARATDKGPLILLLLDLDNFGFNQFKSVPPRFSAAAAAGEDEHSGEEKKDDGDEGQLVNPLRHLFVWSFFGSCFTRHYKTWPSEVSVCEELPSSSSANSEAPSAASGAPRRATIWQRLVRMGHVHFTPCAGQSQAADNAMLSIFDVFGERDVILLTGDKKLLSEIYRRRRIRGCKSRRDNENDLMSDRLTLIDVNDGDRRFIPVWRELEKRVEQVLQDIRSRTEAEAEDSL